MTVRFVKLTLKFHKTHVDSAETYLLLENLNMTSLFHVFISTNISFFKILRLNETELRNMGVGPFELRQKLINASQQCLAKYDFTAPYYPEASPGTFRKNTQSRFFQDTKPDLIQPLSDPSNLSPTHPSP